MDDGQLVLDWERGKNSSGIFRLPTFAVTAHDCIWLLVVVGLTILFALERFRLQKFHTAELAALAEARRSAAINAERHTLLLTEQLRNAQDEWGTLALRYEDEVETVVHLERKLSLLRSAQPVTRGPQLASGSAGER